MLEIGKVKDHHRADNTAAGTALAGGTAAAGSS